MAKIWIISENGKGRAEVLDDNPHEDEEPHYVYRCQCGREDTARGSFEDTAEAAVIHVDQHEEI